ncbi:MAG: hydroxymethylbilane synthase [bacterium]|nr:hydroxymethylbilane synthase [bacterium]
MKLRIGTRGSELALWQARKVEQEIARHNHDVQIEIRIVKTTGCLKQGTTQAGVSDKKEWVHELEQALLASDIDIAVHSAKDVPGDIVDGTWITSVLPRANPLDVLLSRKPLSAGAVASSSPSLELLQTLPSGARLGTASKRRRAQLLYQRPDLEIQPLRGNVPTRLRKLLEGDVDFAVLAAAGIERLGLFPEYMSLLSAELCLPAVNQGILAVQSRIEDDAVRRILLSLVDTSTEQCFIAEREVVRILGADCNSAVGVFAEIVEARLSLRAQVFSVDGEVMIEARAEGAVADRESIAQCQELGAGVAKSLLAQGAEKLLH